MSSFVQVKHCLWFQFLWRHTQNHYQYKHLQHMPLQYIVLYIISSSEEGLLGFIMAIQHKTIRVYGTILVSIEARQVQSFYMYHSNYHQEPDLGSNTSQSIQRYAYQLVKVTFKYNYCQYISHITNYFMCFRNEPNTCYSVSLPSLIVTVVSRQTLYS